MPQDQYRVYTEACELGDLLDTLEKYSKAWRRRRNVCHWLEAHEDIIEERKNRDEAVDGKDDKKIGRDVNALRVAAWRQYLKARNARAKVEEP